LKIKLIGFDSMGTRGMATVVEFEDLKIFIDPGVSIAPKRYGLDPHPLEIDALEKHLEEIHREAIDSDILIISHYHKDHYLYRETEANYYRGKVLIIKDPRTYINNSQRLRAYKLLNKMNVKENVKELLIADNNEYIFDKVKIKFSKPLPHGPRDTKLGYVVMTMIEYEDYKILHGSDVQGPIDDEALNIILENIPDLLIISGPPTYFEGYKISRKYIRKGIDNLKKITVNMRENSILIVDHHLLRDLNYREKISDVIRLGERNKVKVLTAAEYMGFSIRQLEALRKKLWREDLNQ